MTSDLAEDLEIYLRGNQVPKFNHPRNKLSTIGNIQEQIEILQPLFHCPGLNVHVFRNLFVTAPVAQVLYNLHLLRSQRLDQSEAILKGGRRGHVSRSADIECPRKIH